MTGVATDLLERRKRDKRANEPAVAVEQGEDTETPQRPSKKRKNSSAAALKSAPAKLNTSQIILVDDKSAIERNMVRVPLSMPVPRL
jgi:hypothetical protein